MVGLKLFSSRPVETVSGVKARSYARMEFCPPIDLQTRTSVRPDGGQNPGYTIIGYYQFFPRCDADDSTRIRNNVEQLIQLFS